MISSPHELIEQIFARHLAVAGAIPKYLSLNAFIEEGLEHIRDGDALLVSGSVGDHGISVLLAREQFGLRGERFLEELEDDPLPRIC